MGKTPLPPPASLRKTVLYISGPITPTPENPAPYEEKVADAMRVAERWYRKGYTLIVPHRNNWHMEGMSWDDYMACDLELLRRCDGIVMMQRWELSRGAKIEHALAKELRLVILYDDGG